MRHTQRLQWYKLLIALFCCSALFIGNSGVSLGNRQKIPEANFSLLPYYDLLHVLKKPYFVINAHPGEQLREQMYVTNIGDIAGTVELTPVDATTAQAGGAVYIAPDPTKHNVGTWITPEIQQMRLVPNQNKVVQFFITVPKDARPGQHIGGIVARNMAVQQISSTKDQSEFKTLVQHITIMAIEVILPGPQIAQIETKGVQVGGANNVQTVILNLQNTGNVMVAPVGSLQLMDTHNVLLQNLTIHMDIFLPQTAIAFPLYVKGKAINVGTYQVTLTLHYDHKEILYYKTRITVTQQQINQTFGIPPPALQLPWGSTSTPQQTSIIIILTIALFLLLGGLVILFYRNQHTKDPKHTHSSH